MRYYRTPKGLLRLILAVGLLAGAAFVEGLASNLMLFGGLGLLAYSWIATFLNIRKTNKLIDKEEIALQREQKDSELVDYVELLRKRRSSK